MSLSVGKLTKIKSRYKVVEDWQLETNEYKIASNYYRNNYTKSSSKPLPPKIGLALFAYLYEYKSEFSKTYRGKHMKILPQSEDDKKINKHSILNKSNANPNDYDFRGQLIRMELPLISYHTNVCWEVYFEKVPIKIPDKTDKNEQQQTKEKESKKGSVLIKAAVMDRDNKDNDDLVRIKITNFDKFISMNMENNAKSLVIELKKSELIGNYIENDDKSDFETDDEEEDRLDSDYDENDPRYVGLEQGDPFVSGEYYFIGIISNKVDQFDTDTNNYHLDGFGIDSASDYIYVGEGNNVIDTEELDEPWTKPPILNLDIVRVECNMQKRQLTFYKNGEKFGPKDKDYTLSFDQYGSKNKTWYPAVCIVNKNVKAVFKYL